MSLLPGTLRFAGIPTAVQYTTSSRLALGGRRQQLKAAADPERSEFFLDSVLRQALGEGAEVDLVEGLVLVEAGEDVGGLAGLRVDVGLEALGADFFHHALHRAVDGANRPVGGLQVLLQDAVPSLGHRRHHLVGADGNDAVGGTERNCLGA